MINSFDRTKWMRESILHFLWGRNHFTDKDFTDNDFTSSDFTDKLKPSKN
jgi:hypothetical protein